MSEGYQKEERWGLRRKSITEPRGKERTTATRKSILYLRLQALAFCEGQDATSCCIEGGSQEEKEWDNPS